MRPVHELERLSRRRLLRVGGASVAAAAVFAACRVTGDDEVAGGEADRATPTDLEILRTASSLDHAAVVVYTTALDSELVTAAAVGETLERFRRDHREHAELFERATADAGGEPFTSPNPVVVQSLEPALGALADEAAVLSLLFDLERVLTQTSQSVAGASSDRSFDVAVMSVGASEARHAAVLAQLVGRTAAPTAFGSTDEAVQTGTGLGVAR